MSRTETTHAGLLALLVAATVVGLIGGDFASAEQGKRTSRRAAPASAAHSAPDVTGSLKSAKPAPPPAPTMPVAKSEDDAPLKPFDLPAAPRARMRQCGETWQKVKLSGEAGDRTWREFATACLTERPASSSVAPQSLSSAASQ